MKVTIKRHIDDEDSKQEQEVLVFDKGPYKIDIEMEEEIGDDIIRVTGLRGLNLRDKHIKISSDCWYENYKNKRTK